MHRMMTRKRREVGISQSWLRSSTISRCYAAAQYLASLLVYRVDWGHTGKWLWRRRLAHGFHIVTSSFY